MQANGSRPLVVGPESGPEPPFPLRLDGQVVKGFGRGSKDLGIPTANIPIEGLTVGGHSDIESGVYYGWAGLSSPPSSPSSSSSPSETSPTTGGSVYPMVMSIGWNPFYKNTVRSVEVHIMHAFEKDFYGSHMNLVILGFIRPELDYVSKEKLIEDIRTDIEVAGRCLERAPYKAYRDDDSLLNFEGKAKAAS